MYFKLIVLTKVATKVTIFFKTKAFVLNLNIYFSYKINYHTYIQPAAVKTTLLNQQLHKKLNLFLSKVYINLTK